MWRSYKSYEAKKGYNKYFLDSQVFKNHLNTCHNNCGDFILSHYSSIQSLLNENENELKTVVTYSIGSFFKRSRVDNIKVSEASDMDESEDEEGMIIESDSIVERGSINSYQTVSIDMTKKSSSFNP